MERPTLLEAMQAVVGNEKQAEAAIEAVAAWFAICKNCDKEHYLHERNSTNQLFKYAPTWADPDDNHTYRPRDRIVVNRLRGELIHERM